MGNMQARRIAPWVAASATVAGARAECEAQRARGKSRGRRSCPGVPWLAATLASTGVGLVLATRRGENPIGWLLLANGLVLALIGLRALRRLRRARDPDALPRRRMGRALRRARLAAAVRLRRPRSRSSFPTAGCPRRAGGGSRIAAAASFAALIVCRCSRPSRYSEQFEHVSSPLPQLSEAIFAAPVHDQRPGRARRPRRSGAGVRTRMRRSSRRRAACRSSCSPTPRR